MSAIFLKVLQLSAMGSWMIGAVLLLRVLLKKAPRWSVCLLWALVAVRLCCPLRWESRWSLLPPAVSEGRLLEEWAEDYVGGVNVYHENTAEYDAAADADLPAVPAGGGGSQAVADREELTAPKTLGRRIAPWLASVWAAGVGAMGLYAALSVRRLRKSVEESVVREENIYLCDAVTSPFILGVWKPKIYLPSDMDEPTREAVLSHERSHLRRGDHYWKPLGFLILSVHWFNPLCHLAYALLCRDIELACDERVVRDMDMAERKDYSAALLACSLPRSRVSVCPLAFGEVGVGERVEKVLRYKKPAFYMSAVALAAACIALLCFMTRPKGTETESAPTTAAEPLTKEAVLILAERGEALDWADFEPYASEEVGSGLYIRSYEMDGGFRVLVGGVPGERAQYVKLCAGDGAEIDLRTRSAEGFFEEHALPGGSGELLTWENGKCTLIIPCEGVVRVSVSRPGQNSSVWNDDGNLFSPGEQVRLPELDGRETAEGIHVVFVGAKGEILCVASYPGQTLGGEAQTLNTAIREAVLRENAGAYRAGDFACESHALLGMESRPAVNGKSATLTLYLDVLYMEYTYANVGFGTTSGSHGPVALTFAVGEGDEYTLEEYWAPRDGNHYATDIRKKFPPGAWEAALDNQRFTLALYQNCTAQAIAHWGEDVDTDVILERLMEALLAGGEYADAAACLDAHPVEHREFLYYGETALRYCREQLALPGEDTPRRGVLRALAEELSPL